MKDRLEIAILVANGMSVEAFLIPQLREFRNSGILVGVAAGGTDWAPRVTEETGAVTQLLSIDRKGFGFRDATALWTLVRWFRHTRPEIVIASTPKGMLLGIIAARIARVPRRVAYLWGLVGASAVGIDRHLALLAERTAARFANEHLAVSQSLAAEARRLGVFRGDQGLVLGLGMSKGVDVSGLRARAMGRSGDGPESARYLWVGRLAARKGFHTLAGAWLRIRAAIPTARLTVVGGYDDQDPPDDEYLRRLQQDPTVKMVGHVADIAPHLQAGSILLFPSAGEGFPNAPMEAAALGIPTIGFDVMGVKDAIVNGITGVLLTDRSTEAFAAAAIALGRDPAMREALGAAAARRVERDFQQDEVTRRHVEYFIRGPGRLDSSRGAG